MAPEIKTNSTDSQIWEAVNELALDLRWCWSHASDELWAKLHPEVWELTRNPWLVLQSASRARLAMLLADPEYRRTVDHMLRTKHELETRPLWFQQSHPEASLSSIAYFSMEFMLSEALPIYSGGLGNVAGDQMKSASDLGVPVVGIGLLYQRGYFRQEIDSAGMQQELYPFNEPAQLPIQPVRKPDGEWLRLAIEFPGRKLWIRPWRVQVGRVNLYLLDTNDPGNLPADRSIASELYGGGLELRLRQEILLGIGGWRLLRALSLDPDVCHLNEGHAAFAALERAHDWMISHDQPFRNALAATRAGNLFTTHTPIEAGFDRYPVALMRQYFLGYAEQGLGIPFEELLDLGRAGRNDAFNMAYLAIRSSIAVNGVSRLHGQVSRGLFQTLFPRWPEVEVPVGHVTNGVHMPTWDSQEADRLWTCACGKDRWLGTLEKIEADLRRTTDERLWKARAKERQSLVEFARTHLARDLAAQGRRPEEVAQTATMLDPGALTLGFARRFAKYKRPNLLLHDQERLTQILTNARRPVQIVIAGKAHPKDGDGHAMIKEWMDFVRRPDVRHRAVFLSNYDMLLADQLVHGVDVWINTPLRP
ncbi:MAG: alpha-glucan family phosphorylase [Acidobacteriota bacterium]